MKLCNDCAEQRKELDEQEAFHLTTTCEVIAEKGRYYTDRTAGHARMLESKKRKKDEKVKKYGKRTLIYFGCFLGAALIVYGLNLFFGRIQ